MRPTVSRFVTLARYSRSVAPSGRRSRRPFAFTSSSGPVMVSDRMSPCPSANCPSTAARAMAISPTRLSASDTVPAARTAMGSIGPARLGSVASMFNEPDRLPASSGRPAMTAGSKPLKSPSAFTVSAWSARWVSKISRGTWPPNSEESTSVPRASSTIRSSAVPVPFTDELTRSPPIGSDPQTAPRCRTRGRSAGCRDRARSHRRDTRSPCPEG